MSSLKIDYASVEAARYACEHWHYSRTFPTGKQVLFGVWEHGKYIGAVIFRNGAKDLGTPYGLNQFQVCELARVALREHQVPVTRIVAIAVRMLRKANPGLRLIVSFADPFEGHHGGIYQGGNWIYTGVSGASVEYLVRGKWYHSRSFRSSDWSSVSGIDTTKLKKRTKPGKHRYVMPLDDDMRQKVSKLARPYPKKATSSVGSDTGDTPTVQVGESGSTPTSTLHQTRAAIC